MDINLCFADMMHECSIPGSDKQRHCNFFLKLERGTSCMHCRFDCFCQNQDAYPTAKTVRVKAEDLPDLSWGESDRTPEIWGSPVISDKLRDDYNRYMNARLRDGLSYLDRINVKPEDHFIMSSTPSGENKMFDIAGKCMAEAIDYIPVGYATIPEVFMSTTEREFIDGIIHYACCVIEEDNLSNVLTYRSFERFPDYNKGIRFLFKTKVGTYINCCIDLGEKFTDTKAREFGECLGRDIIYHYQAVSN